MATAAPLYQLNRPARYLGGELGSVAKDWSTVDLTFALAFPDVYEVGMSHIGSAILYRVLNTPPWIAAPMATTSSGFTPPGRTARRNSGRRPHP